MITTNISQILRNFRLLQSNIESPNEALYDLGEQIINKSYESFEREKDPITSENWQRLSPATLYSQHRGRKKLKRGGESASFRRFKSNKKKLRFKNRMFQNISYSVVGNSLDIGVNVPYALVHQKGGSKTPQRRFLPFKDNLDLEDELANDMLESIINSSNL
jgi:phage gpG-like protein